MGPHRGFIASPQSQQPTSPRTTSELQAKRKIATNPDPLRGRKSVLTDGSGARGARRTSGYTSTKSRARGALCHANERSRTAGCACTSSPAGLRSSSSTKTSTGFIGTALSICRDLSKGCRGRYGLWNPAAQRAVRLATHPASRSDLSAPARCESHKAAPHAEKEENILAHARGLSSAAVRWAGLPGHPAVGRSPARLCVLPCAA